MAERTGPVTGHNKAGADELQDSEPGVRSARDRMKRLLVGLVKLGLGLGLVAYLVWGCWQEIVAQDWGAVRWPMLVAGFAVLFGATLLTFVRWYVLVRAQGLPFRLRDSLRLGFIGVFFNLLMPSAVGGDLVKAVLLAKEQSRRTVAVTTVLVDRIVGLVGLVLLGGLVVVASWQQLAAAEQLHRLAQWTLAVVAVTVVGFGLLCYPPLHRSRLVGWFTELPVVGGPLREAVGAMEAYGTQPGTLAAATVLAVLGHVGFVSSLWFARAALADTYPPASVHFMIAPLGLLVGAVPLTPGGLGLAEGAMQALFSYAKHGGAQVLLMMLAFRAMQVATAVVGLCYYVAARKSVQGAL